jgi:hypothetical protein
VVVQDGDYALALGLTQAAAKCGGTADYHVTVRLAD